MKPGEKNKKKEINIEELLNKKDKIQNQAIQNALTKLEEQKQKAQEDQILENIAMIQQNTQNAVENLRMIRSTEKSYKTFLQKVADAEQQFYVDADFGAYQASIAMARMFCKVD